MTVVSNASPLIALARIGQLEILETLYSRIIVPDAVWQEVVTDGAGEPGAAEVASSAWIQRQSVSNRPLVTALRQDLAAGEAEAIALAHEIRADLLLMDEKLGRETAQLLGLTVIGTVGTLIQAKRHGHLPEVCPLLDALQFRAGFHLSPALRAAVLRDTGEADTPPGTSTPI